MFRFRRWKKRAEPQINVTPLVDVVLQLVIFFIVTTTFISVETGAQVNLPAASFSQITETKTITVTLTKNNTLYLNGTVTDWRELSKFLVPELRKDPQVTVVIEADREVLHGKVVKLMDLLKRAGVERMAIATQPGEEE
ncbi:ExbD/TolR family protein [Candidatus Caldatribacterium sp.]|uniref:ExbD/TolR family protein n=1 Tax=Candidatus Caldatribacterium sp. TaxID=2282143 RepID=UPI0038429B8C|nr:biopolymer transporter ExbD [Candidatus Caldatribacterium sp.]